MPTSQDYLSLPLPYQQNSSGYFEAIRGWGWPIWLDSGEDSPNQGRFDILSAAPGKKLIASSQQCVCEHTDPEATVPVKIRYTDAWSALKHELPPPADATYSDDIKHLPFRSGMLGYLGYDLGRQVESLDDIRGDDTGLPLLLMGYYQWSIVQDHKRQTATLVCEKQLGQDFFDELQQKILDALNKEPQKRKNLFKINDLESNLSSINYREKIDRIQSYIHAGDCYQVNFSQRFKTAYQGDLFGAYLTLREKLPSPFSCFFETEFGTVLSLSPERFILSANGQLLTQPIKGTAPRGTTSEEDQRLAQELQESSKDQAENLMIVDLLRNDLSKVCQPHTVKTPKLFNLESYANVHHLVSSVTGVIKDNASPIDILEASFPGGSITGAPKIRAMEIIEELEESRRSVYCGSIGYIDRSGQMDTNIAIRTIAANDKELFIWGGGGIVADSEAEKEYQETLTKIGLIMKTLEGMSD